MSGILDDLIKTIEQESEPQTAPETHSMFSHSDQFEKYVKEDIAVGENKG